MKFGITMFPTDYAIGPGELAREVEAHGFESLFFPEHTHIPASRRSPWPGGPDLPEEYSHTLDLFVALTAAAAATERLLVGSGICLVIERDPITLAKEVASLDSCPGGGRCWASARAGTWKRWRTTGRTRRVAGGGCARPSRRCERSGGTTRPSTTASWSISTRSGSGRSPSRRRVRR